MRRLSLFTIVCLGLFSYLGVSVAQDKSTADKKADTAKSQEQAAIVFTVADGGLQFTASGTWKKIEPKVNMIEAEFNIPKQGKDENDGRMTVMGAGGSIEDNINRWIGQFSQADGSDTKESTKTSKSTVNGLTVHMVDISGDYADSMGGPQAPKVDRKNYRMLAAIVETANNGKYFLKFYGPSETVSKNAEHFKKLIESVKEIE